MTFITVLNSRLLYCAPLSQRTRMPLTCSGGSHATASVTDWTADDDMADVENT